MALPIRVRVKNSTSATTSTAPMPSTHRLWLFRTAPNTRIGSSVLKLGMAW